MVTPESSRSGYWGRHVFAMSALILFCANGFGFKPVYEVSLFALLIALILQNKEAYMRAPFIVLPYVAFIALLFPFPQLAQLTGVISLLFIAGGSPAYAVSILCAALPAQVPFEFPNLLLHPLVTTFLGVVGYTAASKISSKQSKNVTAVMVFAYGVLSIISITTTPVLSTPEKNQEEWSTRVGDTLARIIGKPIRKGGVLLVESPSTKEVISALTIVAEHDTKIPAEIGIETGIDYLQHRPWRWNQPLASEVIRFAVANDGFLVTNRGTRLHGSSRSIVSLIDGYSIQSIILKKNVRLIIADSDMLLNFLSPYQASFCRILADPLSAERILGALNGLVLIVGSALLRTGRSDRVCVVLAFPLIISMVVLIQYPRIGDVRWVGNEPSWPHDNSGFGLVAAMQKQGMNVIFGERECKILTIGSNMNATSCGERFIILEPGATVTLQNGDIIACNKRPLGTTDDVLDARELYQIRPNKSDSLGCKIIHDNVILIGTGSPARQTELKKWMKNTGK